MQRGFEGVQRNLPLVRRIDGKMPFKACGDEGLKALDSNQGVEKRNDINEVVIRTYKKGGWRKLFAMCICYKGLGDNCRIIKSW